MTSLDIQNVGTFDVNVWRGGSGSPLLFLHGYERHPGGASFLTRLAETHEVTAPEQPGYGTSTGFENIHEVSDLALFYRAFAQTLGGPIDVIGHSTGAMMAAELAVIAPGLVRRLVLVDPFGLWLDDQPCQDPFGAADDVKAAKWHDVNSIPDPEPTIFVADPAEPHGAIFFSAQNLATATKFMWPFADRGLRRRLPYISSPTLIVNGASDQLVPVSYAEEFARLVPSAELSVIADAGHYPMFEQEDAFLSVVTGFLSS